MTKPGDIEIRRRKRRAHKPDPNHPLRDWLDPKRYGAGLIGEAHIAALKVANGYWNEVARIEENVSDDMLDRPTWSVDARGIVTATILAEIAFDLMMSGRWSGIALELIRRRADETLACWKDAAPSVEDITLKPSKWRTP